MFKSRQFIKILFVFVSVLGSSIVFLGMFVFVAQNTAMARPELASTETPSLLMPDATPTSPATQNASEFPTLPAPSEPVVATPPLVLEWEPLSPLPEQGRGLITSGSPDNQKVALTFDVCQTEGDLAGYDAKIVRILSETQTPATFFLGGLWMRDHQAETLTLARNPLFELGNHSWSHLDFSVISPEEMNQEILLTQQIMFELLGFQSDLFRLPYGTYNETALDVINENGLYIIQWDVVSGDPDPNIDAESMTDWVLQQVYSGSIIIMHANGRGWHTAEALPGIIQTLRQNGYSLVTISELLEIQ